MGILDGLKRYHNCFGLRGVLAISSFRILGWPTELSVAHSNSSAPVYLRVRTTDISIYESILKDRDGNEYSFDLGFCPRTIIDAGANIGVVSIFFAMKYPDSKIIAVEAEESNFEMLQRNVAAYPNILPVHAALWSRDGEIAVGQPDPVVGAEGEWAFVTHEGEGAKVRAITMRTLMKEAGIDTIDLLKMDIEGAEKEVFKSCDWVSSVRCLMIELHDRFMPGCSDAVDRAMAGFQSVTRGEVTTYSR